MLRYILKRIFIFIPTLIIITLMGFVISINAPGDPVERMVSSAQSGGELGTQSLSQEKDKIFWRKKLGLDLPVFYFSLTSLSRPDTLYRIYDHNEKEALDRMIGRYGNWEQIQHYANGLRAFYSALIAFTPDSSQLKQYDKNTITEHLNQLKFESLSLRSSYDETIIAAKISKISAILSGYPFLASFRPSFEQIKNEYATVKANTSSWKNYVPRIAFYKTQNQYHRWLFGDGEFSKGLIHLDFGKFPVAK
jgi:hypothetical protein